MISVVIVDDHVVVRKGLRLLLEQQPDLAVVGEGGNGEQAIALAAALLPDVVLLDLLMPKMDGVTAVRKIKEITPTTQIIVLTSYYEDDQIFGVIKAGALSYLLKESSPEEVVAAVRAAATGESRLHPMVAARLLREVQQRDRSPLGELTPRELEVLAQIARGRSNQEIAAELSVSERTVKTHISNILSKLHLADRTQAAIYALQQRLVPLKEALENESCAPSKNRPSSCHFTHRFCRFCKTMLPFLPCKTMLPISCKEKMLCAKIPVEALSPILGMTFLSVFSKQAPVFLVCLRLFLRDSEKNILAFPFIEFHVPSK